MDPTTYSSPPMLFKPSLEAAVNWSFRENENKIERIGEMKKAVDRLVNLTGREKSKGEK